MTGGRGYAEAVAGRKRSRVGLKNVAIWGLESERLRKTEREEMRHLWAQYGVQPATPQGCPMLRRLPLNNRALDALPPNAGPVVNVPGTRERLGEFHVTE